MALTDIERDKVCKAVRSRCQEFVAKRPRLRAIGISQDELFSEVVAKLLNGALVNRTAEMVQQDAIPDGVAGVMASGGEKAELMQWLLGELSNALALQHRCIDILRRNSPTREVPLAYDPAASAPRSGLGTDRGAPSEPIAEVSDPSRYPSADLHKIKAGLLGFARLQFQANHDCFSMMLEALRLHGESGEKEKAAGAEWPFDAAIDNVRRRPKGPGWTGTRAQAVRARLILDEESRALLTICNGLFAPVDTPAAGLGSLKKELIGLWNAARPDDLLTPQRLDRALARIREVTWSCDVMQNLASSADASAEPGDAMAQAPVGVPAAPWPAERMARARLRRQSLESDWEALEVVEILWRERDIQDEILLAQTKAWPNRQIAAKLKAEDPARNWTAARVEQAVRKLRLAVDHYKQRSGLDGTDFEAVLARAGHVMASAPTNLAQRLPVLPEVSCHRSV
jgi:hypothetical protein